MLHGADEDILDQPGIPRHFFHKKDAICQGGFLEIARRHLGRIIAILHFFAKLQAF